MTLHSEELRRAWVFIQMEALKSELGFLNQTDRPATAAAPLVSAHVGSTPCELGCARGFHEALCGQTWVHKRTQCTLHRQVRAQ